MAVVLPPHDHLVVEDDDYIDMDTSFLCYNISSPSQHGGREFEFQMSASKTPPILALTAPADELFYKGKLLPLHRPSSSQIIHRDVEAAFDKKTLLTTSVITNTNTATSTTATTPFESCNVSPVTSCYPSGELNPQDYYYYCYECPAKPKKSSWSKKKLNSIGQSPLALKLKASKAYIKSLFTKKGSPDESSAAPKVKESSKGFIKIGRKDRFVREANVIGREEPGHRRSFSGAVKWHSSNSKSSSASMSSSSSSSSSSDYSSGVVNLSVLKRSSSVNSEGESSIHGAIAYCKRSQERLVCATKSVSDVGLSSLSASKIAAEDRAASDACFRLVDSKLL